MQEAGSIGRRPFGVNRKLVRRARAAIAAGDSAVAQRAAAELWARYEQHAVVASRRVARGAEADDVIAVLTEATQEFGQGENVMIGTMNNPGTVLMTIADLSVMEVEVEVDDKPIYRALLPPSGLSHDGPSRAYQRFAIQTGQHRLTLKLSDSGRSTGFDYERTVDVDLRGRQNLVVDFRAEAGGFVLR